MGFQGVADFSQEEDLFGRLDGGVFFRVVGAQEAVDRFDEDEEGDRCDRKREDGLKKQAVLDFDGIESGLTIFDLRHWQREAQSAEVDAADEPADGWGDDVVDEGLHDRAEGGSDDDPDSQVDDVASHGEFFELIDQLHGDGSSGEGDVIGNWEVDVRFIIRNEGRMKRENE